MSSFNQSQWPSWAYGEVHDTYPSYSHFPNYSSYLADSMETYQTNHHHLVHHHQMSRTTESKPRLSKEEVEILEAEFQKNHKPNSTTKKALAESMRVDNARINNWFQNRRAREKKERNIREYEARQKMEKDKPGVVPTENLLHERKLDLVASSAPFPTMPGPSRSLTETPESSVVLGRGGGGSELCDSVLPSTETTDGLSEGVLIKSEPQYDSLPTSYARRTQESAITGRVPQYPSSSHSPLEDNDGDFSLSTDEEDSRFYINQASGAAQQVGYDYIANSISHNDDGSQLKSPAALDIASRRNKRPPTLSISSPSRSYSAGLLKTGADMNKRLDCGNSMRRVASANGPTRICKPMGPGLPRTPYFNNRHVGDMSQMKQDSVMSGAKTAGAPPTPDTPIVANQPGMMYLNGAADADSDSTGRLPAPDMIVHDPTLRTPPTTPGVVDNFLSINALYDGNMAASTYPMPLSMSVPSYIANANGCSSQPQTPSFHPQMNVAGYFGVASGNTEYQWSDNSASRSHSPPGHGVRSQFMNMTSSNYPAMGQ